MARELSPLSLVSLPRLSAQGAMVLAEMLRVAAAAEKRLPKGLSMAIAAVGGAQAALSLALQAQLSTQVPVADTRKADAEEDNAVGALHDFLSAWARLPGGVPQATQAQAVLRALFPSGLGFLRAEYAVEWAEVQRRIERLRSEGLDVVIGKLGGQPFVDYLLATHAAYGKALGITEKTGAPKSSDPQIAEALRELQAALRRYIIKAVAHVEADDPESESMVSRLLSPIAEYESRLAGASSGPKPDEPDAPDAPDANEPGPAAPVGPAGPR